ncbi:hypothetical protein AXK11_00165 [Cephaloticoccus primus]|uniref:PIN domain-containing protein n=2 Tax=Cephaloticoccus primus TaxID=1548207 RepID=A0A139SSZ9_9BACT|nr:hypothetical protein AXK11_00165 [Cephaloticoccus primus]
MVEVLQGIRSPQALTDLESKFEQMIYLPTDKSTWQLIQKTSPGLLRAGLPTAMPDLIIAGCAIAADATVFTYDSDFDQIPDLKVIHSFA